MTTLIKLLTTFLIILLSNYAKAQDTPKLGDNPENQHNCIVHIEDNKVVLEDPICAAYFPLVTRLNNNQTSNKTDFLMQLKNIENHKLNFNWTYNTSD